MKSFAKQLLLSILLIIPVSTFAQGNALQFDGVDDHVLTAEISHGTTFTYEGWFNITESDSDWKGLISTQNSDHSGDWVQLVLHWNGAAKVEMVEGDPYGVTTLVGSTVINNKGWYHVATTYDGTTLKVYVNGVLDGSSTTTKTISITKQFYIMAERIPSSYTNGKADEVRIWNVTRTAQEILDNMTRSLSGRETGLLAYYTMNASSGTSLADQTTNGETGTLTNGPTWVASNAGIRPTKGNALDFDGSNDYVTTGSNITGVYNSVSVEAWINPSANISSDGYDRIVSTNYASNWLLSGYGGTSNALTAIIAGGNRASSPANTVTQGVWQHVAFTFDHVTDSVLLYHNGIRVGSGIYSGSMSGGQPLTIGAEASQTALEYFNGKIDEVRVWNTARTVEQIRDNMNTTLSGNESGLVAYYDFNGTTGTKLMDLSLSGNHGTLTNMENADWVSSEIGWSNTAYIDNTVHFRTMSSPVTTSYADILSEVWLQGTGTTGGDNATGSSNVWTWNNAASGDASSNWTAVTNFNANVSAGQGFLYYHFNNDDGTGGSNASATQIAVSGTENSNPTITVNTNTNGWTLVGNPFSQPIHWEAFATKTNLYADAQFYNGSTGAWVTTAATPSIAPFRAFFVRSTNSSGALSIGTAAQRAGSGFRGKSGSSVFELAFSAKSGTYEDEAMVRFSPDGKSGNDWMDAKKLNPLSARYLAMPVYGEEELLAINSLPIPESEIKIPIGFDFTASGTVTLGLRKNVLPDGWSAVLVDTKTGAKIPVTAEFAYTFDHEFTGKVRSAEEIVGSPLEMKSVSEPRFTLLVTPSKTTSNEGGNVPTKLALEQNFPNPFNPSTTIRFALPNSGNVKLEVLNMLGQTVATVANGAFSAGNHAVSFDASKLSSGMYLYRINAGGSVITKKMTLLK